MANLQELKKYLSHEFSSGSYTGSDYKTFQTKYLNYLRSICKENHWELVNIGRNHYCFSAFIKSSENKCVYLSISDVRYFTNEWYGHILIRTARTSRTTAAVSTTTRHWSICPQKPQNFWTTFHFKEKNDDTKS